MALWVCRSCGCKYAVGLSYCPQCTSTDYEEDGMAKTTVHGGASNAAAETEAGEQPSDGDSSSTSTPTQQTPTSEATTGKPKSARTTGNRSGKAPKAGFTARSTGSGRGAATSGVAD